jgi:hypothetical protein
MFLREGQSAYLIVNWALSRDMLPELIEISGEHEVVREAIRILLVLNRIQEDPFYKQKKLQIQSKGIDYEIRSTHSSSNQEIIGSALVAFSSRSEREDSQVFARILRVLMTIESAKCVGDLSNAVPDLVRVELPLTLYSEDASTWMSKMLSDLGQLIRKHDTALNQEFGAQDGDTVEEWLQWFRAHDDVGRNSFIGLLTVVFLERLRVLDAPMNDRSTS